MVRKTQMKRISYDEEFALEMEKFEKNILLDKRIEKFAKNPMQRFSAAIRIMIQNYNAKFKAAVLDKIEPRSDSIKEGAKKS